MTCLVKLHTKLHELLDETLFSELACQEPILFQIHCQMICPTLTSLTFRVIIKWVFLAFCLFYDKLASQVTYSYSDFRLPIIFLSFHCEQTCYSYLFLWFSCLLSSGSSECKWCASSELNLDYVRGWCPPLPRLDFLVDILRFSNIYVLTPFCLIFYSALKIDW